MVFWNSVETNDSRIPNAVSPFPVATAIFEAPDASTYDLSAPPIAPARINGLATRVNGSNAVPGTSQNDSKYDFIRFLLFVSFYIFP